MMRSRIHRGACCARAAVRHVTCIQSSELLFLLDSFHEAWANDCIPTLDGYLNPSKRQLPNDMTNDSTQFVSLSGQKQALQAADFSGTSPRQVDTCTSSPCSGHAPLRRYASKEGKPVRHFTWRLAAVTTRACEG